MIGAIAGDIVGSVHELTGTKRRDFELFVDDSRYTDDTVLAVAVADCLLRGGDYTETYHQYFAAYPDAGYGAGFFQWASSRAHEPYNSCGNGAAMRVPAIGHAFDRLEEVIAEAARSAVVTHNHPEGVRGAEATAAAVFLAKHGDSKAAMRRHVERLFGYGLDTSFEVLRRVHTFDTSCQQTVPAALIAFLASTNYESAVRNAVSLGGDADTLACIAGAVAEAFYGGVPDAIATPALSRLDNRLKGVVARFAHRYGIRLPPAEPFD